jgi:SagB-type dehydrogenase family enzyme
VPSYISDNIFFLIKNKQLVLWDYQAHKQYSISPQYLCRLLHLSQNPDVEPDTQDSIDQELLATGVVSESGFPAMEWGWDDLSRIFHVGTSKIDYAARPESVDEWAIAYQSACDEAFTVPVPRLRHESKGKDTGHCIALTRPVTTQNYDLQSTLSKRRSVREFLPVALTKQQIELILYYSLAYLPSRGLATSQLCPDELRHRRSSPSGGGLNAIEGYVYINNVAQIPPGFYYYNPVEHQLESIKTDDDFSLGHALNGQFFAEDIPFGIFLTCQFDRLWWKYPHSRAYRVALLDAGHISQTVQLVSTALGLGTWVSAAIDEACLEPILGDSHQSAPLLFVGAGVSTGRDMPVALEALHASGGAREND